MIDRTFPFLAVAILGLAILSLQRSSAQDVTVPAPELNADLTSRLITSIEIVFGQHVDPPTRGELLRRGIQGMFTKAGISQAESLGRQITELRAEDYGDFLSRMVEIAKRSRASENELQTAFLGNLLESQRASNTRELQRYVPETEYRVQRQIRENRYVGIGIQLSLIEDRPAMYKVFPGGPASRAGGRDGDLIVSINGVDTQGMNITSAIDVLRGRDGEPVTLTVRQPKEAEDRTLELVRGEVPIETVVGRVRESEGWLYDVEPTKNIAYVRIDSVRGSTVGELRNTARRLKAAEYQALVLDLRQTQDGDVRYTIMLADELLGEAPMGAYTDARGTHPLNSNAQCLLPQFPLAILIDMEMPNGARWLAATLQDNERAVLVGIGTPVAEWYVNELTKLADGAGALLVPTANFHRPLAQAAPNRRMIRWTQIPDFNLGFRGGFGGSKKYDRIEQDLKGFLQQPGANRRSLLPDHFVGVARIPGQRITEKSLISRDPNVAVAIEVLREQVPAVDDATQASEDREND